MSDSDSYDDEQGESGSSYEPSPADQVVSQLRKPNLLMVAMHKACVESSGLE